MSHCPPRARRSARAPQCWQFSYTLLFATLQTAASPRPPPKSAPASRPPASFCSWLPAGTPADHQGALKITCSSHCSSTQLVTLSTAFGINGNSSAWQTQSFPVPSRLTSPGSPHQAPRLSPCSPLCPSLLDIPAGSQVRCPCHTSEPLPCCIFCGEHCLPCHLSGRCSHVSGTIQMPARVEGLPDPSRLLWGPSASCPLPFTTSVALNHSYVFTRSSPSGRKALWGQRSSTLVFWRSGAQQLLQRILVMRMSIHRVSGSERGFKVTILLLSEGSPCAEEAGRWTDASWVTSSGVRSGSWAGLYRVLAISYVRSDGPLQA